MPPRDQFVRSANLMSALTTISRVAGLIRDKVCSYYIGAGAEWSAFWIGFVFPNLFRRIFGEGALASVLVPAYTEVREKQGQAAATRLASATMTLLVVVLTSIVLVGEAIVVPLAFSENVLPANRIAAAMIAIMLPYGLLVCLVAVMGAIGTVHGRFGLQAISPIVLNLAMAGAAALSVAVMTRSYPLVQRAYWVAFAVVGAGVLQVLLMLPMMWRRGVFLRPAGWRGSGIGAVIKPLLPMIIGLSAVQINTALDSQIAWWLSPDGHGGRETFMLLGHVVPVAMESGAVAKLSIAQRIYLLPVGIFGVAMAMAIYPSLARAATMGDRDEVKRLLVTGLRKTLFLSIPSSLGMILIAEPLITLVYLGGQVNEADVRRAYWAAIFYCMGIWAFEAQMVIARVFYVLKDTMTPAKVAIGMVFLNLSLNLALVWYLREGGIALGTTLAAVVQGALLLWLLRRKLGRLGLKALLGNMFLGLLAAVVMVSAGLLLSLVPMPWESQGVLVADEAARTSAKWWTALVKLPLLVMVCAGIYLGLARFLKMKEVADVPVVGKWLWPRDAKN